jgi:hypothetical protein
MRETTWRGASVVEEENDARAARDRNVLPFAPLSASILNRLYIYTPLYCTVPKIYTQNSVFPPHHHLGKFFGTSLHSSPGLEPV